MDYLELTVQIDPREPWAEILMVELADQGFESFVETTDGFQAYGQVAMVDTENPFGGTSAAMDELPFTLSSESRIIPQQNWNAVWEADFQPVVVENYLTILAPFHEKSQASGMLIEIQPKMSFGTGHHQTTWMMSKAMFELDQMPAHVLDMGTGTGVLAIIAEKSGAEKILAVDIEDWSVENTIENAERNGCTRIQAVCGDIDCVEGYMANEPFGLILANINKNVLKVHLPFYVKFLAKNGTLLLSGFFDSDVDEIATVAESRGLKKVKVLNKDNWAAIQLVKL